jgi:hypothetical protein
VSQATGIGLDLCLLVRRLTNGAVKRTYRLACPQGLALPRRAPARVPACTEVSSHRTPRWRKRDSNPQSHLKEEAAELHLFNSAGPLSIARAHSEVVAPRGGRGGTTSSNPLCSSGESVSPANSGAIGEEAAPFAAVCAGLGT